MEKKPHVLEAVGITLVLNIVLYGGSSDVLLAGDLDPLLWDTGASSSSSSSSSECMHINGPLDGHTITPSDAAGRPRQTTTKTEPETETETETEKTIQKEKKKSITRAKAKAKAKECPGDGGISSSLASMEGQGQGQGQGQENLSKSTPDPGVSRQTLESTSLLPTNIFWLPHTLQTRTCWWRYLLPPHRKYTCHLLG